MGRVQVMALNPARKGNMGRINSSQPLAVYDQLIAQPWLKGVIEQIRGEKPIAGVNASGASNASDEKNALDEKALAKAREELKKQLPFRAIHYSCFRNSHRSQGDADPESFLFQTTVDVDDAEYVEKALEKARELNCSDTIWKGKLLHLEYSARKKLHIDIRMPVGMTIEETQRAYCEASGIPYDKSCITPERIIFITDKDSEIYRSKEWYEVLPMEEISLRREAFLKRGLTIDGRGKAKAVNSLQKVNSLKLKVNSKDNVQDNRFQGTNGDNAVYAGAAFQPAQPGDSHRVNDSHLSPAGNHQDAGGVATQKEGGVATQEASEKNLIAFELFKEAAGLSGMDIDTIGSRHSSLLAIMSAGASRVMGEEELMKVVAKKMPSYYEERDCHQLIHDFYAKYGDSSKPFSRDVIRINAAAEQVASGLAGGTVMGDAGYNLLAGDCKSPGRLTGGVSMTGYSLLAGDCKSPGRLAGFNSAAGLAGYNSALGMAGNHKVQSSMFQVQSKDVQSNDEDDYPAPPPMPEKLPKLVQLMISKTPEEYQPAVAHAIFPPLGTHLWKTRFNYIDNVEHEASLMCCLLANSGSGKSCVHMPISMIMEDIRKRDQENLKREKDWKDELMRKGANKDKRKRPDNLVIQEIDADMTNPAFVMRTAEAQEHFLYTSLNELDQFDALKGTGNQQFRIMCLAFDPGNKYGQTRVGIQSVTERVTIRFNWNASTTISKGQRYFSKVLTDGPISRINFCTIPDREIGAEMPVYGKYDDEFKEQLKPYIENLCQASGLVDCPEAFELARKLKEENADFARMSQDRVFENLSFRANVIAYLKACVLYVANGYQWEPEIDEFIRWSEQYDLYCKMRYFGEAIARMEDEGEKSSKRGPSNLLQLLPDTFSFQQVEAIRLQYGKSKKGTTQMLRNWIFRKYIRKVEPDGKKGNADFSNFSNFSFEKLRFRVS